jgi:hypothetical protein
LLLAGLLSTLLLPALLLATLLLLARALVRILILVWILVHLCSPPNNVVGFSDSKIAFEAYRPKQ